jgi:hypothetical protein
MKHFLNQCGKILIKNICLDDILFRLDFLYLYDFSVKKKCTVNSHLKAHGVFRKSQLVRTVFWLTALLLVDQSDF